MKKRKNYGKHSQFFRKNRKRKGRYFQETEKQECNTLVYVSNLLQFAIFSYFYTDI